MDIFGYRVGFDLSKGKIPRFRESDPIVTSDRNDSRAKPRSRHSSSRLNYDHGHYSGQTRLSVSTRPSRLLLSRPFREKRRVFVVVLVILETWSLLIRFIQYDGEGRPGKGPDSKVIYVGLSMNVAR